MSTDQFCKPSALDSYSQRYGAAVTWLQGIIPDAALLLSARLFTAAIFFQSGRTKMNGLSLSENTFFLFQEEYSLPWINPYLAAYVTTFAEHLLPILLVLGCATRVSALLLLMMTLVIQLFVYPDAWPTHGTWATLCFLLIAKGAGGWSLDFRLNKHLANVRNTIL